MNMTRYGICNYQMKIFKGQLISKGLFGVIVCDQKINEIYLRISALASKISSNQKTLLYDYVK